MKWTVSSLLLGLGLMSAVRTSSSSSATDASTLFLQSPADTALPADGGHKMVFPQGQDAAFRKSFQQLIKQRVHTSSAARNLEDSPTPKHISLRRHLAIGDFAAFNDLLVGATIQLPDVTVKEGRLTIDLKSPYCQQIEIGDILLSYNQVTNQLYTFTVQIVGLNLKCYSDYDYSWRFLDGGGDVYADVTDSSATTQLSFTSPNFNTSPPTSSNVDSCVSNVNISDLDFDGGFVNSLLDAFERLFRGAIENAVEDALCAELSSLGTTFVQDALEWAETELNTYLQPIPPTRTDVLYLESILTVPTNINLLDFQNVEDSLGSWVADALEMADSFLGGLDDDSTAPDGSGQDLGVNTFLRQNVLASDRSLTVAIADLPFQAFDPVLFKSHDLLTETTITLKSVKVFGLDTFSKFDPLVAVGKYTLENVLHLDYITVELDLEVDIKPSTNEDSIIDVSDPSAGIVENIQVSFGVDNLNAGVALLLAIDEDKLKGLEIGSLLRSENILACFASVLFDLSLAGFDVSVGSIRDPVLSGFVSPGIDRIVSNAIEFVFLMYEPSLIAALPSIFQGPFRDIVEDEILASDFFNPTEGSCTWLNEESSLGEYIDFRDLFLPPTEAASLGASGDEPYGNLAHILFGVFQDRIVGTEGGTAINDIIIGPITERQSGTNGELHFPSDLFSISLQSVSEGEFTSMISAMNFSVGDTRVRNLASVSPPLELLEPTRKVSILWNDLRFSPASPDKLAMDFTLRLKIDGDDSPWTTDDEIIFQVSLDSMALSGELKALVETFQFLRLPLQHVFNVNCWLSMIPPPDIDEDGNVIVDDTMQLGLFSLYPSFAALGVNASCVSCSKGLVYLPQMLNIFESTGAMNLIEGRLTSLSRSIFLGQDPVHTLLERMLVEAPYSCPVSPQYDEGREAPEYPPLGFPKLSSTDLDTLLFATVLLGQIGLVAISENHRQYSYLPADPLGLQATVPSDSTYLDWTNFGDSLGLGSLGDQILDSTLSLLEGSDAGGNLRINSLVESILDDDESLSLSFEDASVEVDELVLSLDKIAVKGLNSFRSINLLDPIGPQTLSNDFVMDSLEIDISLYVDIRSTEEPPQKVSLSFGVDNLSISLVVFAAIDVARLQGLELGSILGGNDLLLCILSTFDQLSSPRILINSADLRRPDISGLMTQSSSIMSATTDVVWNQFEPIIEEALPVLFDTSVRKIINSVIDSFLGGASCPEREAQTGFVDFRDMFGGIVPYGSLPGLAIDFLKAEFLSVDESTGLAKVNSFIQSWTGTDEDRASGGGGTGEYWIDTLTRRFRRIGIDRLRFAFGKGYVENLDTVEAPVALLEPNEANGTLLDNRLELGGEPDTVRLSVEALLQTWGDPALSSKNDVELSVDIADIDVLATVLARLDLEEFLSMRLSHLLDFNCWLALFHRDDNMSDLMVDSVALAVSSLQMQVSCLDETECSSGLSQANLLLKNVTESEEGEKLVSLILDAVQEILEGDYIRSFVDEFVEEAALACPDAVAPSPLIRRDRTTSFPQFSMATLQKLAAVIVFGLEVGAAGIFETHASMPTNWTPLSAQDALSIDQTELIDFKNFSTSIGDWANTLVDELRSYAEGGDDGPRLNEILRSFFLDDNGVMGFNLSHVEIDSPDFGLQLLEIRLRYLDTFSAVDLLDMVGNQTIRNVIAMDRVRGELDLTVRVGDTVLPLTVHMELEDVSGAFSILLAVNKEVLGDVELGQLLFRENLLKCFFSAMPEVFVTELDFNASRITSFGVEGVGESSGHLESLTSFVLSIYGDRMAHLMRPFFGTTIRAILNNWFANMVSERYESGCPLSSINSTDGTSMDLRDLLLTSELAKNLGASGSLPYGDLFQWAFDILKDNLLNIDEETGLSDANKALIAPLTKAQSGEAGKVFFPGDVLSTDTRIQVGGLDALINFRLYDFFVRNIDTVGAPLSVLEPIQNKSAEVSNEATFGSSEPVQLGFQLYLSVADASSEIRNNVSVAVDLTSVPVLVDALLRLTEDRFTTIPVRHLTNFSCWLWMIPAPTLDSRGIRAEASRRTLGLTNLDASVGRVALNVACNDCSSPGMQDLSELLTTEEASDAATDVSNMLFEYMTDLLGGDYLQNRFDRLLNDAQRRCPVSADYDPNYVSPQYAAFESPEQENSTVETLLLISISTGIAIAALLAVMTCVRCVVRRRHRRFIRNLPGFKVQALLQLQSKEASKENSVNDHSHSLFKSPQVPSVLRWGMPVIILGNIGFFLSGHLSLGATVNIEARLAEQDFVVRNFFEFSMLRSTIEIWNAGGKELAVMIFIFSVLWPYTKQLITLAVWFAPPSALGVSRRGSTLQWLDTLAKWSMVDIMTLIVTVAGFRISIESPNVAFLPDDFYSLNLLVVPMWGLYANMIAQLISQLSSHAILHYHRRIVAQATKEYNERFQVRVEDTVVLEELRDDASTIPSAVGPVNGSDQNNVGQVERLSEHAFLRPHRGEADKLIIRRGTSSMVVLAAISVTALVVAGCVLPSFSLDFLGILGVAIESGQEFEEARTEYTVFTIVGLLFEQANFSGRVADYFGLGSLASLLILSVLVVPVVQSMMLLYVWFTPMCEKRRHRLAIAVEILQAWQYAEVYLLSVIVASWQLGPVSNFMINTYCENLKDTFSQLVYYGVLKEEDAQCFRVEAHIENASYVLAAASVALALLNTFVMRAVTQYFRDIDLTVREMKAEPGRDGEEIEDVTVAIQRVTPVPVLFSDAFRWFLVREDSDPSRRAFVVSAGHTPENISDQASNDVDDTMMGAMKVTHLEPSPWEFKDYYEDGAVSDSYDEPGYYEGGITAVPGTRPRPRQPDVLPVDDTIISSHADQGNRSSNNGEETSFLENQTATALSSVSALTEEPSEPWRDY